MESHELPLIAANQVRIFRWRSLVIVALSGLTVFCCKLTESPNRQTEAGVTMNLPYQLGTWWGFNQEVSQAEKTLLPPDTEFVRKTYESSVGDQILCSIVLSGAEKRSIHRPEICLPGQGWTIQGSEVIPVGLITGKELKVMKLTLTRPAEIAPHLHRIVSAYYLYWFIGQDKVTPYHWERIWLTSWDRVIHHTNHRWAYVIVSSLITEGLQPNGKSATETLVMLKKFIADVVPYLQKPARATHETN